MLLNIGNFDTLGRFENTASSAYKVPLFTLGIVCFEDT